MRIPPDFLDELRARLSPSAVIGRRLPVRRHGREFMALCPFHNEKTPSFTINDQKGFYHCFGCGAHGDIITFVKEFERVSYVEAVQKLAGEAGLAVPKPSREDEAREQQLRSLHDVCEAACAWFEEQLRLQGGAGALRYIKGRGLTQQTIQDFRIGFAPAGRDGLKRALMAKGVSEAMLVEAGLLIQVEGKPSYDRFRERIMFPIRDRKGRVVAFGGRLLEEASAKATQAELPDNQQAYKAPKYLNSPETPLFHKGRMLFNWDRARDAAMKQQGVFVCEGYMDVIMLAQAGIMNAMAPLGTAMTSEQLQALWQLSDAPTLCLDGDTAGERAMQRAADLALPLLQPGKTLQFMRLPEGDDPDSLVRRKGAEAFYEVAASARALSEVLWQRVMSEPGAQGPERKAAQEKTLMQLAEQIAEPTVRAHFRAYFREKLWPAKTGMKAKKVEAPSVSVPWLPAADEVRHPMQAAARQALLLALRYPALLASGEAEELLAQMELGDDALDALRQALLVAASQAAVLRAAELRTQLQPVHGKAQDQLERNHARFLPKPVQEDAAGDRLDLAQRVWRAVVNQYQMACVLRDCRQAEAELASEMSEAGFARLAALKQQVELLRREQSQWFQHDPMSSEAASG